MVVYNVTVNIDFDIHAEWLQWMNAVHIPGVLKSGCFIDARICRVLVDDETGETYSIQYTAESMQKLEEYQELFAPALQQEHRQRYEGKFAAFRTTMEVVGQHKP
jgi:hypothetical protein